MININTILSTFDERGTLLKWLKTTNNALKNASLKSVEAIQPTATTLQLKFIFADDSSLLSPPITLPKGEPGKDATLPGYINFFSGQLETTFYDTNEYNFKAPYEMKSTETGEVLKTGYFNFTILIGGSDFIAVDLDETDSFLQIKLDETKVDTEVKEGSTNLITSGGAFKNDPLFFETENTLDTLSPEEATAFDLLIKKSFLEKRPIVAICPESIFYQLQAIGDGSNTYFIGAIDDRSQFEIVTFYKKNETWGYEYDFLLNYTSEFLWNFSSDNTNYQIKAHVVSINNDLILKQNELTAEVKMNYIYNFFLNNMISSLSLEFNNKWNKIVEITFENQTDYTFYYLENGVIKSELIDASIIL